MAGKKMEEKKNGVKCEMCNCTCGSKWASVGWVFLLVGGLAHMLPVQMAPLLRWGVYGITLQMAVGVLSVVMALYFLLGE